MAWTTPKTWATGEVLTSTDMNVFVRDNLKYLKPSFGEAVGSGTDFSTTSTTYTDILGMSVSITTGEANLLVVAFGEFTGGGYPAYLAINIDGTDHEVGENASWSHVSQYVCAFRIFPIAMGSHVVKLRCRTDASGTASFVGGTRRRLIVAEGVF